MHLQEVFVSLLLLLVFLDTSVLAQKGKCPKVGIKNGRVKIRARGKMAYFKCRKRFTRLGDKFAVCLQSGTWSHPPPTCISAGCPSLGTLPNMEVTESYNGAMLKFVCPVGTKRNGAGTITCDGRVWSDAAPVCEIGLTLSCDFEKEGLCGWSQDESDNFDWTRKSGTTPTMGTGPQGDHTTGTGYFMFIESSSPRKVGDVARLISPTYPPSLTNFCFSFWYHMQGPDEENAVGSLEVYVKPDTASVDDIDPEFYMDGNKGPDWQRGFLRIPDQDENFQIYIVGTRKDDFTSDIAIDDWKMYNCSDETTTMAPATSTWVPEDTAESTSTDTIPPDTSISTGSEVVNETIPRIMSTSTTSPSTTTPPFSTPKFVTTSPANMTTSQPTSTTTKPTTSVSASTTMQTTTTTVMTRNPTTVKRRSKTSFTSMSTPKKNSAKSTVTDTTTTMKTRPPTSTTSKAVTTVYKYSHLATKVMKISTSLMPTSSQTVSTTILRSQPVTSPRIEDTSTSSGEDVLILGTSLDSDALSTASVSSSSATDSTPDGSLGGTDTRQTTSGASGSLLPLIIGVTAGIVVGMLVIGLLAWLWARSQRKKKEREAAEDEMYMLSTGDAAGFNFK